MNVAWEAGTLNPYLLFLKKIELFALPYSGDAKTLGTSACDNEPPGETSLPTILAVPTI